jgi:hypothetical protein
MLLAKNLFKTNKKSGLLTIDCVEDLLFDVLSYDLWDGGWIPLL